MVSSSESFPELSTEEDMATHVFDKAIWSVLEDRYGSNLRASTADDRLWFAVGFHGNHNDQPNLSPAFAARAIESGAWSKRTKSRLRAMLIGGWDRSDVTALREWITSRHKTPRLISALVDGPSGIPLAASVARTRLEVWSLRRGVAYRAGQDDLLPLGSFTLDEFDPGTRMWGRMVG